ncbi:hypothetical protein Tco_0303611 [Tanacetum coccineum]
MYSSCSSSDQNKEHILVNLQWVKQQQVVGCSSTRVFFLLWMNRVIGSRTKSSGEVTAAYSGPVCNQAVWELGAGMLSGVGTEPHKQPICKLWVLGIMDGPLILVNNVECTQLNGFTDGYVNCRMLRLNDNI